MYAPAIPVSSSSGLHFKNRAALGPCAVAKGTGIQVNSLLIQEERAYPVREAPKRKSGREERKGHVKHVTRRRDSRCTVRQRHQKQEPVSHKHFIAVNKRILSCSSITELAHLVSQEKKLNEVNVCSATTQLHRLLRQLPDTGGTPHYSSSTDQRASSSSSSSAAAGAAAEAAAASQMLPTLVNATLSVDGLSPDHCVRILTAHAWINHMLPPQAWQLQQQSGLRLDSSSSREAWHSMLQRLCSTLAAASTTTPPEHLSRGLWACARLGHVHSGLVAAASARMLHLVQERHGGMPQEQQQQQQYPAKDGADPLHQGLQAQMGSGYGSSKDDGCNTEGKSTVHALPASAEDPLRSTLSQPAHGHNQQDLPASQHVHTKPSPPSLADTLSNLVWALGQLLQPPSTPQPNLPPPQHHASHSNMSNTAAAMGTMNRGNHHEAVHGAVHGTACTPEVVQLVAAMQQRVTEQPEWLARWGPQRMATFMHGLANLQLTRLRALNTSGVLGPSLQASSSEHLMHLAGATDEMPHPGHRFSSTSSSQPPTCNSTTPSVPSQLQLNPRQALCSTSASLAAPHQAPMHTSTPSAVPPTPPSLILALCQSVHCLLANHSSPSQRSAQQAEVHMPQPAASSEQNAKGASLCPAAGVPTAAHLPPQALSNMAWSLATLWSLADQQPVLEKRFSPRDSQVDAHLGGRDGRPEAGRSSMASSTYISSTTINQSASSSNSILPGAPSEREPQAHELHAACAHAVRAIAHAALGQQGHGLLRFSPHELCSLVQAVADLHAAPPPDPMNQSAGTPAAGTGHSGTSKSAARGEEAMSSSSNSPSSSTSARALNSQRRSMFTASSPSGISPPHRPPLPPQPIPAGVEPATTHRPAAHHAYTHGQQHSPAVALFLQKVFAAALDSVAARVSAFPVVDCCEVLHACAMVGLPPTPPAAVTTAPHEQAPQQQAQQLRYHLQALCARIEAQPQELPSSRVPMLLWSMARLGLVPARLLAYLLDPSEATTLRSTTTAARTGLATIGDNFSQADGIPAAASSTSDKAGSSSTSQGMENVAHRGGAERMAAMAGGKTQGEWALAGLSPDRLAKVEWALATMAQCSHADAQQQQLDHPHIEQQQQQGSSTSGKAQQELQQQGQPDFQLQQQQQLQQQDRDPRALALSLLLRLEPDAVQLAEAMDNQSLCMVLWAFASNRCHCPRLLAAAAPELLRRCMVTGTAAPPAASAPVSQPAAHSSRDVHQPLLAASMSAAAPPAAFPPVSQPSAHSTAAAAAAGAAAATPAATLMTGAAFAPPAAASAPVPQPAARSTAPAATPAATHVPGAAFAPSATSTPDPQPAAHTSRNTPPPPSHSLYTARSGLHQPTLVPPLVQGAAPTASLTASASSLPSAAAAAAAAAVAVHPSPSAPGTAAAAAPQASSASKRAAGAAAAVLHTSPSAPGTSPSAPNSSPLPAQAVPCADALDFLPASQAAVGMDSHSSSSNSSTTTTTTTTNTSSRRVGLGSTKLRRGIRLRRPGPAPQAGLRLKLHSRLGTASTRTLHASPPPTGSDTCSSTPSTSSKRDVTSSSIKSNTNSSSSSSSSIDTRSGAMGGKGEHEAAMFTMGFDGLGSSSSSTDGNTPSSSTSIAPLSSSIHASSTSGRTSSVGGPRATAPQALSCQQLAMALWAVARLLEAGHNQLGTSMAPLRLFRAAAPAVAHAAATSQMDAKNLAMVTWAYASVKVNPGERVLSVLAHSSLRAAPRMSMQGLAMVAHALAQLSFASPPLYASLAHAMLSKAQQLPVLQPRLHQPVSRCGVQQLQQQRQWQQQQQQQQFPGIPVPTTHGDQNHSTAVASLSTMALVLACRGVPCPQIMDVALAATLAVAPARDAAPVEAGAAALTPSMLSSATPSVPQAPSILGHAPYAACESKPSRASSWQADASDAAPTHTSTAQSLQQGTKVRQAGGVSAVELVQLLFALGRAKHPCAPRKLDVLVGMLTRELGLPGLPMQRMQQLPGQAGGSHLGVQQDLLEAEMRQQLVSEQQEEHQLLQLQRQEEAHHLLHQQGAQHSLQQQQKQALRLNHHSPGLLAMFLMACVSLRYQPPQQLLTSVCCTLEGNVSRLSTQTVCELLCSLAALQHDPGVVLLDELVGVVEGRVMQQRQELLTLESLVKLAWGLACLKQYKRPMFKRAVRRALGSSAGALNERPQLLRQLLELKMLFQVERRAGGYWHVLQPSWERRVAAGGADRVPEAVLLQSAGLPPPELASAIKAVEVVKAQVLVMLHALGVDDPKWHSLRQGDQACIFHYAPSRRRGRSNSLEQQLQQHGHISCGRDEAGSTDSSTAAGRGSSMEWAAISDLGGGLHGRDGRQERAVGHPGSSIAGAGKEWGCSSVAFEGRRPTRSRKHAVTLLLAPWHLSVNAGGLPLASAAIRDRILARKQCSVLPVRVDEWLALSTEARRQLLRGFLFR